MIRLKRKPWKGKNGYMYYAVKRNGRWKDVLLHRYLMERHLGRRLKHKEYVDHINGVRDDNRLENLRVCTQEENMHSYYGITKQDVSIIISNLTNGMTYRAAIIGTSVKSCATAYFLAKRRGIR